MNKNNLGYAFETMAAEYLAMVRGWIFLERNVHYKEGELDLVMTTPEGELRFVEVKGRRNEQWGAVVESLTTQKMRRLKRAIYRWREHSGDRRPGELIFLGILMNEEGKLTIEEHILE